METEKTCTQQEVSNRYVFSSLLKISDADNVRTDLISKKAKENFNHCATRNTWKINHSAIYPSGSQVYHSVGGKPCGGS